MSKKINKNKGMRITKTAGRGVVLITATTIFTIAGALVIPCDDRIPVRIERVSISGDLIPEPTRQPEKMTTTWQQAARTYKDVEFVALPVAMDEAEQKAVFEICQDQNIAFPLVMAIIEHESRFTRTARSASGDCLGYMQINTCNAKSLAAVGFVDLFDTKQNVGAGVHILNTLFEKYPGETAFVLMAYNCGERKALNMKERGKNDTKYTREIMARAEAFSSYIDNALSE